MAGIDFSFKAVAGGFFDPKKVLAAADRAHQQVQAKFGAFARRTMKSSLRYKTGKSAPGRPPNVHRSRGFTKAKLNAKTGGTSRQTLSPLRELIFFARDPSTNSVVVGPVKFGGRGGIAPGLLEKGGTGTFKDSRTGELKSGLWKPRPFVRPAAERELKVLPGLLAGSMN